MLEPFPAPFGRTYLLEEVEFSANDNSSYHNLMSNNDHDASAGVVILPVRVVPKGAPWKLSSSSQDSSSSKTTTTTSMDPASRGGLPFSYLEDAVESPFPLQEILEGILKLSCKLVSVGFPLVGGGDDDDDPPARMAANANYVCEWSNIAASCPQL